MLERYRSGAAADVLLWITSAEERDRWCGRREVDARAFDEWHADPDVHAFLFVKDGRACAYGEIWIERDEGAVELARILVRPDARGRGVGGALVRGLLAEAARTGLKEAWVRVVPENAPAIACYRREGFTRIAPEKEAELNEPQPREYVWMRRVL